MNQPPATDQKEPEKAHLDTIIRPPWPTPLIFQRFSHILDPALRPAMGRIGVSFWICAPALLAADTSPQRQREFWSFQKVKPQTPPAVKHTSWVRTDIDRFIVAKLETKGVAPGPAADKITLLRRATFDLIGLPPAPEEVDAFLADKSPDAFDKVVDRLLASPQYGERWGRHW